MHSEGPQLKHHIHNTIRQINGCLNKLPLLTSCRFRQCNDGSAVVVSLVVKCLEVS